MMAIDLWVCPHNVTAGKCDRIFILHTLQSSLSIFLLKPLDKLWRRLRQGTHYCWMSGVLHKVHLKVEVNFRTSESENLTILSVLSEIDEPFLIWDKVHHNWEEKTPGETWKDCCFNLIYYFDFVSFSLSLSGGYERRMNNLALRLERWEMTAEIGLNVDRHCAPQPVAKGLCVLSWV